MRWTVIVIVGVLLVACTSGTATVSGSDAEADSTAAPPPQGGAVDPAGPGEASPAPRPEAFVPAGPVGSADAYDALIAKLEQELPLDLRSRVPWPDTRNPDPVQTQLQIFDLWIWMAEHHPEPALAEIMAVEASPGREEIATIFGQMEAANELRIREAAPYEAFDHRVVTLETAGLPLWLTRGAPPDSVVVYYRDRSGPVTVRNRETGAVIGTLGAVPERQWVSIIAPTEVGWLLYRDQLIEPGDPELDVPDPAPPGVAPDRSNPEV